LGAPVIPLAAVPPGREVIAVAIRAGRGLTLRLMEMGILPGTRMRVLKPPPGPVVIEVRGARLALGWGVAQKILVQVVA